MQWPKWPEYRSLERKRDSRQASHASCSSRHSAAPPLLRCILARIRISALFDKKVLFPPESIAHHHDVHPSPPGIPGAPLLYSSVQVGVGGRRFTPSANTDRRATTHANRPCTRMRPWRQARTAMPPAQAQATGTDDGAETTWLVNEQTTSCLAWRDRPGFSDHHEAPQSKKAVVRPAGRHHRRNRQ